MKIGNILFLNFLFILSRVEIKAEGHKHEEGHHEEHRFGEHKAIHSFDEHTGLTLSSQALERLSIKTRFLNSLKEVSSREEYRIDLEWLSSTFKGIGVFIMKDGIVTFKSVHLRSDKEQYWIRFENYNSSPQDQIVTSGVELLKVSFNFANDKSEYGHSH